MPHHGERSAHLTEGLQTRHESTSIHFHSSTVHRPSPRRT